jgi:hypothetical protein
VVRVAWSSYYPAGLLALIEMPELFFEVEPPIAQPGDFVEATARGGVPPIPVVLELVAMDGVAVGSLVDSGTFDAAGEWAVSDVVPPGLSGHLLELRAWALDAFGKLDASHVRTLELQ